MQGLRCVPRNYLRVRGEYFSARSTPDSMAELPPRARRIPIATERLFHDFWNYLRVRGEYLANIDLHVFNCGTTSACAENTVCARSFSGSARNYLRVRGEYFHVSCGRVGSRELPPRARRILLDHFLSSGDAGTTSACAENTNSRTNRHITSRNYLRVRGEYGVPHIRPGPGRELPPRARRIQE